MHLQVGHVLFKLRGTLLQQSQPLLHVLQDLYDEGAQIN